MNPISWIALRLRSLFGRRQIEDDMQEEMRAHLEGATARLIARGLTPEDARVAARREFGNVTVIEDDAREARGARWIDGLLGDVRFALRYFRRQKLATATLLAVLALGIGANTVIFSGIQAFLARPLPGFQETDSHARLYGVEQTTRNAAWRLREFSYPELLELRGRREAFAAVAGWMEHDVVLNVTEKHGARAVNAQFVTANYFQALGASLVAGTGFSGTDTDPELAAVVGGAIARDYFETPENALGRRLVVNDIAVRVVGVAPPGFHGATRADPRPHIWFPVSARAEIARRTPRWLDEPTLLVFARLAPGVTREEATAIASSAAARLMPDSSAREGAARKTEVLAIRSRQPAYTTDGSTFFAVTLISILGVLILLVACTNVSSLLVASAVTRRHEIAVRLSMGASRARLMRQMLTESALLSIGGGLLGLLVYWWIMLAVGGAEEAIGVNMTPDFGTLAFTMAFSIGTGLLFGLSPALHATRDDVAKALRDSGTGASHRSRLQSGFVVAQLVCSQPLLLMLAVTMSSIYNEGVVHGVASDRVILAQFRPLTSTGGWGQRQQAVDSLAQRMMRHAGVERVVPDAETFAAAMVTGANDAVQPRRIHLHGIMPGYFEMRGLPIVLGRDVVLADTLDPAYNLVISSDLARDLWGDANPIGRTLPSVRWPDGAKDSSAMRVVGVFQPEKAGEDDPAVYTAGGKHWSREALLIRTRDVGDRTIPQLRAIIRADAPGLPLTGIQTLSYIQEEERRQVFSALTDVGAAGFVALLLAMLGLHGVVALSVTQRTREIGIRIAMGARPMRVAMMFVASGVRLTVLGLLIGLPLGLGGIKILLANESNPPVVSLWMIGVSISALMVLVAAAAAWMPARRAAAVDPALTLRAE